MKLIFITLLVVAASCIEAKSLPITEQRGLQDFIVQQLGLESVWSIIQELGNGVTATILQEGLQLIMAGNNKLAQAQDVFKQLVEDLKAHGINSIQQASQMVADAIKKVSMIITSRNRRDYQDFIINELGLGLVWTEIQNLGTNVVAQIIAEGMQLVFAGQEVFNQALAIFKQLVVDLTNHTGNAATLVQTAISTVAALLNKPSSRAVQQRDLQDFIINQLGLGSVWSIIQEVGNGAVAQIISEGMQLVVAGQDKYNQALAVFKQLVDDLTGHGVQTLQTASQMVAQAINKVSQILSGSSRSVQQRDFQDFIINQLGLGSVWNQIIALGGAPVSQILQEGLQLVVAGKEVLAQAQVIFNQLVSDLTNHVAGASVLVANAIQQVADLLNKQPRSIQQRGIQDFVINELGLGSIWAIIQEVGNGAVSQIISEGLQLVVAGKDKLQQAQAVFKQLVDDLTAHGVQSVQAASQMVAQAINKVSQILSGSARAAVQRDFQDFILNTLGLSAVWTEIQSLGANFAAQILNEGMQLLFAGQDKFNQAMVIFNQLVSDLTNHTANAATLVQTAISTVAALLNKPTQRMVQQRDYQDFIMNELGLGLVWTEIQSLGANFAAQILNEGMQLIFAGQDKFNQALVIFNQLVSDLTNHTGNAATLVQTAISTVAALLNKPSSRLAVQKGLADFLVNQLGLGSVWSQIQQYPDLVAQIFGEGMQLITVTPEQFQSAVEIFKQMVADLKAGNGDAKQIVKDAIAAVATILKPTTRTINQQRDLQDFVINELGLGSIWAIIQEVGNGAVAQIISEGLQLVVAGQDKLQQAQAVFKQLVDDLTAHGVQSVQTASQMVAQAINKVSQILGGKTRVVAQRGLQDFIINQLGLGSVWSQIQQFPDLVSQLFNESVQLITVTPDQFEAALDVFKQMVADLKAGDGDAKQTVKDALAFVAAILSHKNDRMMQPRVDIVDFLLNTLGLSAVWTEIQGLGANFVAQLLNEGVQLLFAGQDKLQAAQVIFNQLVSDLTNHTAGGATLVQNAIQQVAALLNKNPSSRQQKIDIVDFLLNTLGLQSVWTEIQSLGSNVVAQIVAEGMQLVFSGQDKLQAAQAIFAQLVSDLTNHTANGMTLVTAAISQVAALLNKPQ